MNYLLEGLIEAIKLLFNFDKELYEVIFLSLAVTMSATFFATIVSVPIGLVIATHEFRFKRLLSQVLYSFMGLPPVVLGLFVFLILSRNGPFGSLTLLFSPTAMVIAQLLLITPIIISLIVNHSNDITQDIIQTCKTLGANKIETLKRLIIEIKPVIFIAVIAGFSRAISEVGAVMMVGGNIKGHTRVMTTFIALNNSQGNYAVSIAMGLILMGLSFLISSVSYRLVMGVKK